MRGGSLADIKMEIARRNQIIGNVRPEQTRDTIANIRSELAEKYEYKRKLENDIATIMSEITKKETFIANKTRQGKSVLGISRAWGSIIGKKSSINTIKNYNETELPALQSKLSDAKRELDNAKNQIDNLQKEYETAIQIKELQDPIKQYRQLLPLYTQEFAKYIYEYYDPGNDKAPFFTFNGKKTAMRKPSNFSEMSDQQRQRLEWAIAEKREQDAKKPNIILPTTIEDITRVELNLLDDGTYNFSNWDTALDALEKANPEIANPTQMLPQQQQGGRRRSRSKRTRRNR
jgi:chromosome segregation ATPase